MSTPPHDHLVDAIEQEIAAVHRETAAIRGMIAVLQEAGALSRENDELQAQLGIVSAAPALHPGVEDH